MSSEQSQAAVSGNPSGLTLSPWAGLCLALLAGAIVWGVIQLAHPVFHVDKKYDVPSIGMPPEMFAAHRRQQDFVDRWHAALYLGGLGLLIAALLGIGEGIARRSWLPPLIAPYLGLVGGAAGGFLGCLVYEYVRKNIGQADLAYTIRAQLLVGVPLGLGVGLGLGLTTRSWSGALKATLAGLAAGGLAGILFPVAVSMLLPAASTDALLPDLASSRLLWLGILSGALGLVIPISGRQRMQRPA